MPNAYKQLAQGQLGITTAALYTAPAGGTGAVIRHWTVVNNDTVDRTFQLTVNGSGATKLITPPAALVRAGGMVEWDGAMCITPNQAISGLGSVASQLTYEFDGDETS